MKWRNLGKSDVRNAAVGVVVLIGLLTLAVRWAEAGEWMPGHPRVYMGVIADTRAVSPECHASNWVGEFGVAHDLYRSGPWHIELAYRHNSCLDEQDDAAVTDGAGVRWIWTVR